MISCATVIDIYSLANHNSREKDFFSFHAVIAELFSIGSFYPNSIQILEFIWWRLAKYSFIWNKRQMLCSHSKRPVIHLSFLFFYYLSEFVYQHIIIFINNAFNYWLEHLFHCSRSFNNCYEKSFNMFNRE